MILDDKSGALPAALGTNAVVENIKKDLTARKPVS
jgi:hypothetical protein